MSSSVASFIVLSDLSFVILILHDACMEEPVFAVCCESWAGCRRRTWAPGGFCRVEYVARPVVVMGRTKQRGAECRKTVCCRQPTDRTHPSDSCGRLGLPCRCSLSFSERLSFPPLAGARFPRRPVLRCGCTAHTLVHQIQAGVKCFTRQAFSTQKRGPRTDVSGLKPCT
jgi:hypothetical protein